MQQLFEFVNPLIQLLCQLATWFWQLHMAKKGEKKSKECVQIFWDPNNSHLWLQDTKEQKNLNLVTGLSTGLLTRIARMSISILLEHYIKRLWKFEANYVET